MLIVYCAPWVSYVNVFLLCGFAQYYYCNGKFLASCDKQNLGGNMLNIEPYSDRIILNGLMLILS